MLIRSWRCDIPSCKTLSFDTESGIRAHQNNHFLELCKQWQPGSVCSWPKCRSRGSNATLTSLNAFKKHLRTHLKNKWCSYPGCQYDRPFSSKHDLDRHLQTAHNNNNALRCPLESCSQSFFRRDKLEEHIRRAHDTCKCPLDHCGEVILDTPILKDNHIVECHQSPPIYECTLAGCESSTSRFDIKGAMRHLSSHHGLSSGSYGSAKCFINRVKRRDHGDIMIMGPEHRTPKQRILPCKSCTQKVTPPDSETQVIGDGDGTEIVNGGTNLG